MRYYPEFVLNKKYLRINENILLKRDNTITVVGVIEEIIEYEMPP